MNLHEHYNGLWEKALAKFKAGKFEVDPMIDSPKDQRFGITLLARLDKQTKQKVQQFLLELKKIEPEQYYYPGSDIHITIMTIITSYSGFVLDKVAVNQYISLIKHLTQNIKTIEVEFRGITASPACILLQGYPTNNVLHEMRNQLRKEFKNSNLQQPIDKRYPLHTIHSTVVRFKKQPLHPEKYINKLLQYREFEFGNSKINKMELVYNNWYLNNKLIKVLATFDLKHC